VSVTDLLARLREGLKDRYDVERELGAGGMALVFLARDLRHDRAVAIKVLRPELASAVGSERFLREIRVSAQLHHPHILPLYESGIVAPDRSSSAADPDVLYYVMPFVEGETLRARLGRETQLPLEEALQIGREVADALGYAHARDVVHRDVKPENILLESGHALVADFGIARAITMADSDKLTETGLAIGTPAYMSPEQASGQIRLDGRSDQYSLGCVMYEMLVGEPPYTGPTSHAIIARRLTDPVPPLRTVRETVPESVEQAIVRALARVPADRFATTAEFVAALSAPRVEARPRQFPARALRIAVATGSAAAVLAAAGVLVVRARRSHVLPSASVIAVLPFTPSAPDTGLARLGGDLMMTVAAALDGVGGVRSVDRYVILSAADAATPYALEPARAAALGRRFGAGSYVSGTLGRDEAGVRLALGIYRTDTHVPIGPVIEVHASADSLFALTDSITLALLRQIWRGGVPPTVFLHDVTTRSIYALRQFLDGERDAAAGRWEAAAAAFHRASQADTTFWVAGWRYYQALEWQGKGEDEDPRTQSYSAHLASFEPRDRAIIEAENTAGSEMFETHLARFRALAEQFPDDWVAAMAYADHLVHSAPLTGHAKAEARKELERTVSLNPALTNAWDHLLLVSVGQDSSDARMALDGWIRSGGAQTYSGAWGYDATLPYRLALQLESNDVARGTLFDSLARAVARSDSPAGRGFGAFGLLGYGFPAAQSALDAAVLRRDPDGRFAPLSALAIAYCWAARGNWDSALVAMDAYGAAYPRAAEARGLPLQRFSLAVAGAWTGGLSVRRASALREAAVRYLSGLPQGGSAAQRARLAWGDGILAVLGYDRQALAQAREEVRRTGAPGAAFLDRSLRAMGLMLRGATGAAADSLALIDVAFTHADTEPPRDDYALALDHLAAAKALLAVGDTGRAAQALVWHEADESLVGLIGAVLSAPAYLDLARIEEAQGRRDAARFHYRQFLRRYDAPSPSRRRLVSEARAALQRLGA
jgi:hypothetical protein